MKRMLLGMLLAAGPALAQTSLLGVESRMTAPPSGATTAEARTVLIQCNPYVAGKYEDRGSLGDLWYETILPFFGREPSKPKENWETAQNFARWVGKDVAGAEVIALQEVVNPDVTPAKFQELLRASTGHPWEFALARHGRSNNDSGLLVMWDPAKATLEKDLGTVDIARLDNRYVAKFMGVLLRHASGRRFAVFTGKLIWGGAIIGGKEITEPQRVEQAKALKAWVDEVLAPYPDAARMIAMDQNADHGSATFQELDRDYEPDGTDEATHSSKNRLFGFSIMTKKLDYIWYRAPEGATGSGFVHPARRSPHFGSDHRAIWSTLRLAP